MTTNNQDAALAAFIAAKASIDASLQRLTDWSADHFGIAPDAVNWAHVAGLQRLAAALAAAEVGA